MFIVQLCWVEEVTINKICCLSVYLGELYKLDLNIVVGFYGNWKATLAKIRVTDSLFAIQFLFSLVTSLVVNFTDIIVIFVP